MYTYVFYAYMVPPQGLGLKASGLGLWRLGFSGFEFQGLGRSGLWVLRFRFFTYDLGLGLEGFGSGPPPPLSPWEHTIGGGGRCFGMFANRARISSPLATNALSAISF